MGDRLNRPPVVGSTGTLPRHACRLVTLRLPGGELWKKALHRLLPGGEEPRVAGREKETGWGGQVSEERRAPVPSPGTPPESAFPSELPSLRARGLARAPRSGASATALAAASDGSRTTSDNYGQYGHLGDFRRVDFLPNGCSPFRPWKRLRTEHARPSQGCERALERFDFGGPTGRVDRLGEPAWRRVHPLPALGNGFGSTASGRHHAARHRARKAGSPTNRPRIDAPRKDMAYPMASLERGARERVEEADAA